MRYLTTLSFVMVSLGLVLANYSISETERYWARFVVIGGIGFFVLAMVLR